MSERGPQQANDSAPKPTAEIIDLKTRKRIKPVEAMYSQPDKAVDAMMENIKEVKQEEHEKMASDAWAGQGGEIGLEAVEKELAPELLKNAAGKFNASGAAKTQEAMRLQRIRELREKVSEAYKQRAPRNIVAETKTPAAMYPVEMPPMDPEVARRSMEGTFKRAARYVGEKLGVGLEKTSEIVHRTPLVGTLLAKMERQQIRVRNTAPILLFDRMYARRNAQSKEAEVAYAASDQTVKNFEKHIADIDVSTKQLAGEGRLDGRSAKKAEKEKDKIKGQLDKAKTARDHFAHRLKTFNEKKAYWDERHKTRVEGVVNDIHALMEPHKGPLEKHSFKQKEVAAELEKHASAIAANEEKLNELKAKLYAKTGPRFEKPILRRKLKELETLQKKNRARLVELKKQGNRITGKLVRITNRTRPWKI